jgi:hypothetical protein
LILVIAGQNILMYENGKMRLEIVLRRGGRGE